MMTLIKHTIPNRYNCEPYKTIWRVDGKESPDLWYIQISQNKESPTWVTMGDFLFLVFRYKMEDESFLEECFKTLESIKP